MTRLSLDALAELCSPFIATIASGETNIGHSNNYSLNGSNRKKLGSNYQKLSNLMIFTPS